MDIKDSKVGRLVRHAMGAALSPVHAGDEQIATREPGTSGPQSIVVRSPAFGNGAPIPATYTPQGANTSPALAWSGVPAAAKSLVLIVEDPDAPFRKPFVHWILHGLPTSITELPAGVPTERQLPQLGEARQGTNDAKTRGWFGPQPPMGHGVHHYHFQLFAIDLALSLSADATLDDLKAAITGHVLAEGELVGTYQID